MTFGPDLCVIGEVSHEILNSGVIGGSTRCDVRFRWPEGHAFTSFIANHPDYFSRPIATTQDATPTTCMMCIARER